MEIEDVKNFLQSWMLENVNPEAYEPEGGGSRARELAQQCRMDAKEAGISTRALDRAVKDMIGGGGSLEEYIAGAMNSAVDDDVDRLAGKDD